MTASAKGEDWFAIQSRHNGLLCDQWHNYAPHRRRVTGLLTSAARGRKSPSICLLGAGNCNDIDLSESLQAFSSIHLVDCDVAAVSGGIERQRLTDNASIVVHGDVDLSGLATADESSELATLLDQAAIAPVPQSVGKVDVAASLCMLSQLVALAKRLTPHSPDAFIRLVQAIRRRHFQIMTELLVPGGQAILITDVVSDATVPTLPTVPVQELSALVANCVDERNFFTGLHPGKVFSTLRDDPWFHSRIERITALGSPWRWQMAQRVYAVYAVGWTRRRGGTVD